MSVPPPINTRLAQAMMSARYGYARPPAMGDGPRGRLFERRMQAAIAARLSPPALAHYLALRDRVRTAVTFARRGDPAAAEAEFAACERQRSEQPAVGDAERAELDALSRSWIDQGYAYHAVRRGDAAAAGARLIAAEAADRNLEQDHGHALMHIGRVHTVHLWLRLRLSQGHIAAALRGAEAVLAYLDGTTEALPFGSGWSRSAALAVAPDLRAAMRCRIAGECGVMIAAMNQRDAAAALDTMPSLAVARDDGPGDPEIRQWVAIKRGWSAGDSDRFLRDVAGFLRSGRGQTCLWYAALLDLLGTAQALRPEATRAFRAEMAERVRDEEADGEILPGGLRAAFRPHAETDARRAPGGPFIHVPRPRRFHLICVGLPRSGTTSLYTLFARHRAGNEYAEAETIRHLTARANGQRSTPDLDAFLLRRDREAALEMDAASFLHLGLDRLVALFPAARFVLPVRQPVAWLDSYLKMLLRWHDSFAARGRQPPAWMSDYGTLLFGRFDWSEIATPQARRRHLPQVATRFLGHWAATTNRTLDLLPPDRSLILETRDLSRSIPRLAAFAGTSREALTGDHHSNASPAGDSPIADLDPAWLAEQARVICRPAWSRIGRELECA